MKTYGFNLFLLISKVKKERFKREYLEKRPIGLRELSELTKLSTSALSRILRGQRPTLKTFMKLCTWLQISPNKFFL